MGQLQFTFNSFTHTLFFLCACFSFCLFFFLLLVGCSVNVFLATYRTFARTEQVIDLLLQRYERLHAEPLGAESFAEQHKKSLVAALHVWLDGYPEDWNVSNLKKIIAFTSKRLSSSEVHHKALNRLERLARARVAVPPATPWDHDYSTDFAQQFNGLCLTPAFMPPSHLLQAYRFPHISVKHFAEQLTRMDMVSAEATHTHIFNFIFIFIFSMGIVIIACSSNYRE